MKKLIYIFLLGLVFVACDKNEIAEIAPVAEIQNITIDKTGLDVDLIIGNLLENLENYGNSKRGNNNNASKGSDFIAVHIFVAAGETFMTLLDESNDDLCFGDQEVTTVFFDNSQGDGSVLSVENAEGTVSLELNGNWAGTFAGANNIVIKLDDNLLELGSASFDDANNVTFATE